MTTSGRGTSTRWRGGADVDASSIRWSFVRDLGGARRGIRLVAIDSRCSRNLDPDDRRMVDADVLDRKRPAAAMHRLARWARVDDVAMNWREVYGPSFDNGVRTLEFAGRTATLGIDHAHARAGRQEFDRAMDLSLAAGAPSPGPPAASADAAA
jgi:hypothetical protein